MKSLGFIILYILILMMVIQNQLLIAAGAALIFTYYKNAVWLIVLGFFIDAYFGAFAELPMFTIVSILFYILVEFIRPRLFLNKSL